jgi:solute carrier family 8 (sodium/calcium exchanger)
VNVYLGIGLAWSIAAIYHTMNGQQFKVDPGSLGFSVLVFCIEALLGIALLMFRRYNKDIGAELGGPPGWRKITSFTFAMLWFAYVILSSMESYCYIPGF